MFELVDGSSKAGRFCDIILGFSIPNAVIENVKSMTFNILTEQGQLLGYSEVMPEDNTVEFVTATQRAPVSDETYSVISCLDC